MCGCASLPAPPDIRPQGDWSGPVADVQKVLDAAAGELWECFPGRALPPILVEPGGGPVVLFARGPNGELQVRLATSSPYWAQMTYQFSHEFTHILCEFDSDPDPNQWFEEAVCEAASLFVLRRSAQTWAARPPYPNWKDYAPSLASYADERIASQRLPEGTTVAAYYRGRDVKDRDFSNVVAVQLLPLFERDPRNWNAVTLMNRGAFDAETTFQQFLEAWRDACPERHRPFVREIAALFDVQLRRDDEP